MSDNRKTASARWFNELLKNTFGLYIRRKFKLRAENLEVLKENPGPWLVLPNHVMTYDPVLVSLFIKDPIHFIASDANFRNPVASWWLRKVGAIPTAKKATDMTTLRQMMKFLAAGHHVGLFPEGERSWDGVSLDIIEATAKLVKIAKVSVISPIIKGGYLSLPRWSYKTRRGPITVEYKLALSAEEAKKLPLDEIVGRIRQAVHHDEYEFQKTQMVPYKSKTPAEPLQLALFACPECHSLNKMRGSGSIFGCLECGWKVELNQFGFFDEIPGHTRHFETIRQHSLWQIDYLRSIIGEQFYSDPAKVLFSDAPCEYSTGEKFRALHRHSSGSLSLLPAGILYSAHGQDSVFAWEEIEAINVVYQSQLEFHYRGKIQSFKFPTKDISGYKYLAAARIIQGDKST